MTLSHKVGSFPVPAGVPALPLANALVPRLEAAGAVSTRVAQLPWDPLVAFVRVGLSEDESDTEAYAVHTGDLASLRALAEIQLSMMLRRGPVTVLSAADVPDDVAVLLDGGEISQLIARIAHVVQPDMPLSKTVAAAHALRPLFEAAFGVDFGQELESTCTAIDECVMRLRPAHLGPTEEVDEQARPKLALMALGLIGNAAVLEDHPNAQTVHTDGPLWTRAATLADAKGFPSLRVDDLEVMVRLPMFVLMRWHRGERDTVAGEARAFQAGVTMRELGPSEFIDRLIVQRAGAADRGGPKGGPARGGQSVDSRAEPTREEVDAALAKLTPLQRSVLELRYLDPSGPKTLTDVGQALGLPREEVRRLEREALETFPERLLSL